MKYFKSLQEFYNSTEWQKCKEQVRNSRLNENGETIDEYTGEPIYEKYNVVFHHKIELNMQNVNDYSISLNPDNIMIVSHQSHNKIHKRFTSYQRKVYLVVGAPCSGKTTFVEQNATEDTLVLDFDKIWQAISINNKYIKPNRLKPVAFALRQSLMEQIKMRNGKWFDCFILTTEPYIMNRQRLINELGIDEVIYMETDKRTCLERLYANPQGRDIKLYEDLINEYYDNLQT